MPRPWAASSMPLASTPSAGITAPSGMNHTVLPLRLDASTAGPGATNALLGLRYLATSASTAAVGELPADAVVVVALAVLAEPPSELSSELPQPAASPAVTTAAEATPRTRLADPPPRRRRDPSV